MVGIEPSRHMDPTLIGYCALASLFFIDIEAFRHVQKVWVFDLGVDSGCMRESFAFQPSFSAIFSVSVIVVVCVQKRTAAKPTLSRMLSSRKWL